MTIRPATPDDARSIVRIYFESAIHHRGLQPDRYIIPDEPAIIERYRRASPTSVTLVAIDHTEITGFVEARLQQPSDPMHRPTTFCHILEIAVAEHRRSEGIGAGLLRAVGEWGRLAGAEFVSLDYLSANVRAAAFYEKLGFVPAFITAIKPIA